MKKLITLMSPGALYLTPLVVLAQGADTNTVGEFVAVLLTVINDFLVPLVIALAVLFFIWGVFLYVLAKSDEAKEKGRDYMIYGIIGLFVIVSVWGLVNVLVGTFDFQLTTPDLPEAVPTR